MQLNKLVIEKVAFPLMERVKGNNIRRYQAELAAPKTHEQIVEIQKQKLSALLKVCIEQVPAYSVYAHLAPLALSDPFEALRQIQPLQKADFKAQGGMYIKQGCDKASLIPNSTSGSSGTPTRFYMDRRTVEHYEAARWMGLSWWGITQGSRSVMIWGSAQGGQSFLGRMKERYLKNRIVLPVSGFDRYNVVEYVRKIERFAPEYIYGYASALHFVADLIVSGNIDHDFKLKAVVSTAEMLQPHYRQTIEQAFGCPVVDEYGAKDAGILAYECRHGTLHTMDENVIMEVVDEFTLQPVADGRAGIVLTTDLNNLSAPRLRYLLGDRAALVRSDCFCGRQGFALSKIEGREAEIFVLPNGKWVHGAVFGVAARAHADIVARFLVLQHAPDRAECLVVPTNADTDIAPFADAMEKALPGVAMEVRVVDSIDTPGSGKLRYAVRMFPLEGSTQPAQP